MDANIKWQKIFSMKIILQNNLNDSVLDLRRPGIYLITNLITNLINGKKYVGSSILMQRRYKEYLNPFYIARNLLKGNSRLLNAFLKYVYSNFEFKILKTIEFKAFQSKSEKRVELLKLEQQYIDEFKPEYNINLKAGSNLGRHFSEEVRKKMSLIKLGKPGNKKGAKLSLESKALFRDKSGMKKSIMMLNEKNEILNKYSSIQLASEATGISRNRISRCARGIRKQIKENGKIVQFKYSNKKE